MFTKGISERIVLAGLSGMITLTLAAASADAAGVARRAGGVHAPRGDYTHQTQRTRTADGHTRHDDWSNAKAKTATRDATVVNDRANGTRTRDVEVQGPNGKTATRDATVVRDKEAGTVSRDVVTTGPNGRTRTVDDDIQRTDDGYTRETVRTNPNGSTLTRDVNATYDPATKTFTKDVSVDHERATPPATP